MRIQTLPREAAAIIKFRRQGYSESIISKGFHRSTSWIQKIIKNAERLGILHHIDYRKMPDQTRKISRALQWRRIMQWLPRWQKWILGEGERPP
jgi:transposase